MGRTPDYAISELEYQALPPVLRRKFFSSLERLRLENDGSAPCSNLSCSRRPSIVGARAASVLTDVLSRSSTLRLGLDKRGLTAVDRKLEKDNAAWFDALPPVVRRKQFSREEQIIFATGRHCILVDAVNQPLNRRPSRRLQDNHFYFCFDSNETSSDVYDSSDEDSRSSPTTTTSIHSTSNSYSTCSSRDLDDIDDIEILAWPGNGGRDSVEKMAKYSVDSFCLFADDFDLDLKLDDYHQAVQETTASQKSPLALTWGRQSSTRSRSLSSASLRQASLSSQTMAPSNGSRNSSTCVKTPSSPTNGSRSVSLLRRQRPSTASMDRQAMFYQDPAARMQLRLYLASPSKFDEAVEFGFPALQDAPDGGLWTVPPEAATDASEADDVKGSFLKDDRVSLSEEGDDEDAAEGEDRGLKHHADQCNDGSTPERDPLRRLTQGGMKTESHARVMSQSYAPWRPLEREMTIHMTLTRPDLRSPDEKEPFGLTAPRLSDVGGVPAMQMAQEQQASRSAAVLSSSVSINAAVGRRSIISTAVTLFLSNAVAMILLAACRLAAACLLLAAVPVADAKKDGPTLSLTTFDSALDNVFYFDDSDIILGLDRETGNVWRSPDAGETWEAVQGAGQKDRAWDLWAHPYDNQRAYIIGAGSDHWITTDRGESWRTFSPKIGPDLFRAAPLSFHGGDPQKVIWNAVDCAGQTCHREAYYTDDDFETIGLLKRSSRGCSWAVATPEFASKPEAAEVDTRVFCVVAGLYSQLSKDYRLLVSDDYFNEHEVEPALNDGRAVPGIISMAAVKNYVVAAAKSAGTDELALFVTADAKQWHRCEFGEHRIEQDAYTILESTNYSMQVDVLGSKRANPVGYLFTSNSNGTYFTRNIDHTNRNEHGRVDFEKISNIQGIVLVNVVDNWDEVEDSAATQKKIQSRISFDDGRTFEPLRVKDQDLHLHSVTEARQSGRLFSSPAPGLVMGVGNLGKFLRPYEDGDTYVSDDAGLTWSRALDGAHLYEFGNKGGVLVAIDDEDSTDFFQYSLDHGRSWTKVDLESKIRAKFLSTAPDSTTLKFLLMGSHGAGSNSEWQVYKIDFDGLHERSCTDKDFETWPARVGPDGKASCILGHKQFYRRRKPDAGCFVDGEFQDPKPEFEPCVCTEADFECDFDFVRDSKDPSSCLPARPLKAPDGQCKDGQTTFQGPSGYRLIPGDNCVRKGGLELDKAVDRPCSDTVRKPVSGEIAVDKTTFDADMFAEWYYLEEGGNLERPDETIVMRTSEQDIFLSRDHGKTWTTILAGEPITTIVPNPNNHDVVYFLTDSKTVHYTVDRGDRFATFSAPEKPSSLRLPPLYLPPLKFHPSYKDWLLWSGSVGADDHTNVFYSRDRGDDWDTLVRYARRCDFIPREGSGSSDQLIYCEQYEDENPEKNLMLLSSDNFFADSTVHFDDILDFATMAEFIIVAAKTEDRQGLKVDASVDGHIFAAAEFPKNFQVAHQQAYTVLDSSTHAVFLHVTVNAARDHEYGTIIKSNSNGTSYVLTLSAVNRDREGYVDFEKMQGLEGVALANVVSNADAVQDGEKKVLKSMITHNDGAEWALIPPPKLDAVGNEYGCVSRDQRATDKCSLHLHSYTERRDKSATFSSASAVGLMMAVGNVGDRLLRKDDDQTWTFVTRDAGISWKSVKKGSYMWEYGDQGSIIVIVPESVPTRSVFYTLDEGESWTEFVFSPDNDMQIDAITTLPSDRSLNFLLWGKDLAPTAAGTIVTINLDFSALPERQRKCDLDEKEPVNEDYELWEPKHPLQDTNCLFGHVSQYHRKRLDADCKNGKNTIVQLHNSDGTCRLVEGQSPPDHVENCRANPDQVEFWYPTGYRKIPLSTCEGGSSELDKIKSRPCPGHEREYNNRHGLSGAGLFFAIVIPICVAAGVGYWAVQQWRSGALAGFGQIRLGESTAGGSRDPTRQSVLIAIPVAILSGLVAVARATPLLLMSLWRSASGYLPLSSGPGPGRFGAGGSLASGRPYRSRDAFANRHQDYSQVVEDDAMLGVDAFDDDGEEV
ncbi:hypothetical protein DV735_g972, partial [Chaetothyriales sp. CBS 134920]